MKIKYVHMCKVLGMDTDTESANCVTRAGVRMMMRQNEVRPPEDPAALPSSSLGKEMREEKEREQEE